MSVTRHVDINQIKAWLYQTKDFINLTPANRCIFSIEV